MPNPCTLWRHIGEWDFQNLMGMWTSSHSSHFTTGKKSPIYTGWQWMGGPHSQSQHGDKLKNLCPCWELNQSWILWSVTLLTPAQAYSDKFLYVYMKVGGILEIMNVFHIHHYLKTKSNYSLLKLTWSKSDLFQKIYSIWPSCSGPR